jgi:hypothetical protein
MSGRPQDMDPAGLLPFACSGSSRQHERSVSGGEVADSGESPVRDDESGKYSLSGW